MKKLPILLALPLLLVSCDSGSHSANRDLELETSDRAIAVVEGSAKQAGMSRLLSVDHSRLAAAEGAVLDANRVSLYSSPRVHSMMLKENIRSGLDLPYRVQAYYHNAEFVVDYTSAEFVAIRHGVSESPVVHLLKRDLEALVEGVPEARPVPHDGLEENYGIVELRSGFVFDETVSKLKAAVLSEGDTQWFETIDFQAQAKQFQIELPPVKLLIFGAPTPGARAMREFPSIGLDAFPQKVLVYQDGAQVRVIYNEIPAMARLHYGDAAFAHKFIAFRLKSTLDQAISLEDKAMSTLAVSELIQELVGE
ncbi:DUF302 domain-containing protein [Rubritalea marina]|uniref:DUF302 domain-containing protein n=1 Tax=Rubritalea marina TaxID=361055 RepID=UPI000376F5C1|nr:DUF302 domain-containing protein [Rubritalea marina]